MVNRSSASSRIRSLEKRFVKERAEISVYRFANSLLLRWDQFIDAGMDANDMLRRLRANPATMDTWPRAIRYINQCISEGRPPDHRCLVTMLAPWVANRR